MRSIKSRFPPQIHAAVASGELDHAHQLELAGIHRIDRLEPQTETIEHDLRSYHIRIDPALFKPANKDTDTDPDGDPPF